MQVTITQDSSQKGGGKEKLKKKVCYRKNQETNGKGGRVGASLWGGGGWGGEEWQNERGGKEKQKSGDGRCRLRAWLLCCSLADDLDAHGEKRTEEAWEES